MTKDTQARPQEPVLWGYLGQAQLGLKKYDDAETSYKKALELDAASKKPSPVIQGMAQLGPRRSLCAHRQGARSQCRL